MTFAITRCHILGCLGALGAAGSMTRMMVPARAATGLTCIEWGGDVVEALAAQPNRADRTPVRGEAVSITVPPTACSLFPASA